MQLFFSSFPARQAKGSEYFLFKMVLFSNLMAFFPYLAHMIWKVCFFLICLVVASACFKKKKFAETPVIRFLEFTRHGDSAKISISFQDGEGDIGLNPDQTISPYDPGSKYHYNLYMVYYEKDDVLGWIPGKDFNGDSIVFKNRILPVYSGKPKGIEGKIIATVEPLFYNPFSNQSDTIKYRIQLIDRALHESQWIESEVIYP